MEWGELRVLYKQKQSEALAAAHRARAIKSARESPAGWPSVGCWLACVRRGPRHGRARGRAAAGGAQAAGPEKALVTPMTDDERVD